MLSRIASLILVFFFSYFYSIQYHVVHVAHHDEAIRVGRGYMLELALHRDFGNPMWFTLDGYDEPMFMQYVYGAMLYKEYLQEKLIRGTPDYLTFMIDHNLYDVTKLDGDTRASTYLSYQLKKKDFVYWHRAPDFTDKQYIAHYGEPMRETLRLIYQARRINVVIMTMTSLVMYYLALQFFPVFGAMVIALWFGTNGVITVSGLKAMNEGMFLLFFLLGVYLIIRHVRSSIFSYRRAFWIGLVAGMCANAKLNGVLIAMFFAILTVPTAHALYVTRQFKAFWLQMKSLCIVVITTALVFIIWNPFTYPHIVSNTYEMYRFRWEMSSFDRKEDRVYLVHYTDRIRQMYVYFFSEKTAKDFSFPVLGTSPSPSHIALLVRVFFIVGFVWCVRRWNEKPMRTFLVIFLVTFISMIWYLSISLYSYYVPLSVFMLWFEGVGLYFVLRSIVTLLQNKEKSR